MQGAEKENNYTFEVDSDEEISNESLILENFKSILEILNKSDKGKNIILNYNKKKEIISEGQDVYSRFSNNKVT